MRAAATKIPLVYCANTSVGVTLLTQLVEEVARKLTDGWDIEIIETHHHQKVDAPSGTALALGRAAAVGRGVALDDVADIVRKGHTGARRSGDIGFAVLRGGDVVGEHSVMFYAEGERVESGAEPFEDPKLEKCVDELGFNRPADCGTIGCDDDTERHAIDMVTQPGDHVPRHVVRPQQHDAP